MKPDPVLANHRIASWTSAEYFDLTGFYTPQKRANGSKGCGGVMRIAPAGLILTRDPFEAGCDLAAITHGHPTGFYAAGCMAQIIYELSYGASLETAAACSLERLTDPETDETRAAVMMALDLAVNSEGTAEDVEKLGKGWVAEEALAIALYCALKASDFTSGVLLAVNHGGDSDSTGSIAGNLLGLIHGERGVPQYWLERLELRDVIAEIAYDLWLHFGEGEKPGWFEAINEHDTPDWDKYPGL
ncbi:ADP-ribosylglycohydrolase family protein [Acidobacteriota bacterium]